MKAFLGLLLFVLGAFLIYITSGARISQFFQEDLPAAINGSPMPIERETIELFPEEQPLSIPEITLPKGFTRLEYDSSSFSFFVQNLPLKSGNWIELFNGEVLGPLAYDMWGVVDMPLLFKQDLEQCADYAMRFWAEYHKEHKKLNDLYLFNYGGKKQPFSKAKKSYNSYLKRAFANSNSHSLKKGCKEIEEADLIPGDMVVQNDDGGIGHVSMIMDICEDSVGQKLYLLGYSFMPAQEFHVERALDGFGVDGWFTLEGYIRFLKLYTPLGEPVLRRF